MMTFAFISDRYHARGIINIFASILGVIGFSMFYGMQLILYSSLYDGSSQSLIATKTHAGRYASLFFSISGTYLMATTLSTWVANNSAPATRRAASIAMAYILYVHLYSYPFSRLDG
jgi:hypothetical protein